MKLSDVLIPAALGSAVALYSVARFNGADAFFTLWYYVPSAIVVGFLANDRLQVKRSNWIERSFDFLVVAIGITRPLFGWPAVSGHALLFVYALLTGTSLMTKVCAVGLGMITIYAKVWLWNWDTTLWPGLLIGIAGGFLSRRFEKQKKIFETAGFFVDRPSVTFTKTNTPDNASESQPE